MNDIKIRLARPEDIPFLNNTWLYALYNGSDYRNMDKDTFMRQYREVITNLMMKPGVNVTVAHLHDDENVIVGWACWEPLDSDNILHFIYMKKMWRRNGIHLQLIPKIKYYTHITRQFLKIKPKELIYNPFLIGK